MIGRPQGFLLAAGCQIPAPRGRGQARQDRPTVHLARMRERSRRAAARVRVPPQTLDQESAASYRPTAKLATRTSHLARLRERSRRAAARVRVPPQTPDQEHAAPHRAHRATLHGVSFATAQHVGSPRVSPPYPPPPARQPCPQAPRRGVGIRRSSGCMASLRAIAKSTSPARGAQPDRTPTPSPPPAHQPCPQATRRGVHIRRSSGCMASLRANANSTPPLGAPGQSGRSQTVHPVRLRVGELPTQR